MAKAITHISLPLDAVGCFGSTPETIELISTDFKLIYLNYYKWNAVQSTNR